MIDKNYYYNRMYQSTETGDWILIKPITKSHSLSKLKAQLIFKHKYNIKVPLKSIKIIRGVQRGMRYYSGTMDMPKRKPRIKDYETVGCWNSETYPERQEAFYRQASKYCVNWKEYLYYEQLTYFYNETYDYETIN